MNNVIDLFPKSEQKENTYSTITEANFDFVPEVYWTCGCNICSFYIDGESLEAVCTGCGSRQRW